MMNEPQNAIAENNTFHKKFFTETTSIIISVVALITLIIGVIIFIYNGSWTKSNILDEAKVGQFGDFIGGAVGTLVAFAGIILYYVALIEQRKEAVINQQTLNLQVNALNHQIKEVHAQKKELADTKKIHLQQTKTMRTQQFDSNFYSLLNVYFSIKRSLDSNYEKGFFYEFYKELEISANIKTVNIFEKNRLIIENYNRIYIEKRAILSTYFKTVYRLIKFVDECDHLNDNEKEMYCKIIRSQISDYELLILYYNYHSTFGLRAQPLILKYQIFKHIQRLSKIEFSGEFEIKQIDQTQLTMFIEWLVELIRKNISKAKDITDETPTMVEELDKHYNIMAGIYIDHVFELKVQIKKADLKHLPFEKYEFANFLSFVLHDCFFLDYFQKAEGKKIKISTLAQDKIEFGFTLKDI